MNASTFSAPFAAGRPRTRRPLHPFIGIAVAALLRLDGWLAARRRRAEDLRALANMSDHELRDLGLHRMDTLPSGRLFAGGSDLLR